jgi:hypothetical protein
MSMDAERSADEMAWEQDLTELLGGDARAPAEVKIKESNTQAIRQRLGRSDGGIVDCCFAATAGFAAVGTSAGAAFFHLIRAALGWLPRAL